MFNFAAKFLLFWCRKHAALRQYGVAFASQRWSTFLHTFDFVIGGKHFVTDETQQRIY
jgi:hypothetical protein